MKPMQFCTRCDFALEEAVVDDQPTIMCWECQTTGPGYLAEEAGLVESIRALLGPDRIWETMSFLRICRAQAQPFHRLLKACRDLLNNIWEMDDNAEWSDVATARVTEFAQAVAAAGAQA